MTNVVIITGSPFKPTRLHGVVNGIEEQLKTAGCTVNHVDVVDIPAEDLLRAKFNSESIIEANKLIADAEAIIIATPVYKASFTGILKAFLDLIPEKGLVDKRILPIAMGGTTAHLLMLEYALKPVLSVIGANHIESGVYIHDKDVSWADEGKVVIADEINTRLQNAIQSLITVPAKL